MGASQNFFELTGSAAVTLTGLLFVVITLGAERSRPGDEALVRTFITPTFIHLSVVLVIALLALSPEGDALIPLYGLLGVVGLAYSLNIARSAARSFGVFSHAWLFHGAIPIASYVSLMSLFAAWGGAMPIRYVDPILRMASAVLLSVGMRNGWAVAVDITRRKSN